MILRQSTPNVGPGGLIFFFRFMKNDLQRAVLETVEKYLSKTGFICLKNNATEVLSIYICVLSKRKLHIFQSISKRLQYQRTGYSVRDPGCFPKVCWCSDFLLSNNSKSFGI